MSFFHLSSIVILSYIIIHFAWKLMAFVLEWHYILSTTTSIFIFGLAFEKGWESIICVCPFLTHRVKNCVIRKKRENVKMIFSPLIFQGLEACSILNNTDTLHVHPQSLPLPGLQGPGSIACISVRSPVTTAHRTPSWVSKIANESCDERCKAWGTGKIVRILLMLFSLWFHSFLDLTREQGYCLDSS